MTAHGLWCPPAPSRTSPGRSPSGAGPRPAAPFATTFPATKAWTEDDSAGRKRAVGLWPNPRCRVIDVQTGKVRIDVPTAGPAYIVLFSPDSGRAYCVTANGWVYGWSTSTGEPLWPPSHQPGLVRPAALSPDGSRIIAGHTDGRSMSTTRPPAGTSVRWTSARDQEPLVRHASGRFVSASTDREAHVWDLESGRRLQSFRGHTDTIISANWSPDSRRIATASYDTTAWIWDVATGQPVGKPMGHLTWMAQLEFSPDGRHLATSCRDGTARLWHAATGEPASPPLRQRNTVDTVRFVADSACLLVRDLDGFRFWDTENFAPVSVHYPEPTASGLGMDSENYRAIMNREGTRVFNANSMNLGRPLLVHRAASEPCTFLVCRSSWKCWH